MQLSLDSGVDGPAEFRVVQPFKTQLLKWIGNKQRFAHEIIGYFPPAFGTYFEPFLGSGGVLGTLAPSEAVAADILEPLMEVWIALKEQPEALKTWYSERYTRAAAAGDRATGYEQIKADFNKSPNGADLVYLARSCYGGVVRFRKDGYMSTPCGVHTPVSPRSFSRRVDTWHERTAGTEFLSADFEIVMARARPGDLVYCDPPYTCTQAILYGAQDFDLARLFRAIEACKGRGVYVVLSIDGTKRSGDLLCNVHIPEGLFEQEAMVNCGRSMLRRFQREGDTLEDEVVRDRLLLTY